MSYGVVKDIGEPDGNICSMQRDPVVYFWFTGDLLQHPRRTFFRLPAQEAGKQSSICTMAGPCGAQRPKKPPPDAFSPAELVKRKLCALLAEQVSGTHGPHCMRA